jgi:hypothetical protein
MMLCGGTTAERRIGGGSALSWWHSVRARCEQNSKAATPSTSTGARTAARSTSTSQRTCGRGGAAALDEARLEGMLSRALDRSRRESRHTGALKSGFVRIIPPTPTVSGRAERQREGREKRSTNKVKTRPFTAIGVLYRESYALRSRRRRKWRCSGSLPPK